jgi:hypothetical protein
MPYTIVEEDGKYCVHKQNVDGSAGERIACHDTKQGAINQIGAIESNEKAESDFDTSEWDGSASNWSSTEAYCRDCLIDLNEGDEKVQSKCKLPFRKEGSTKWNINALKTMATGRGLSAVTRRRARSNPQRAGLPPSGSSLSVRRFPNLFRVIWVTSRM